MAANPIHLSTSNSNVVASSYGTPSITVGKGQVITLAIGSTDNSGGNPNTPTLSGNGMSFSQIGSSIRFGTSNRLTLFRGVGTGQTGAITFDFAGQSQARCFWSVIEWTSVKAGGVNGADAIVQSASDSGDTGRTNYSITLAAFASQNNATYAVVFKNASNDVVPGGSMLEIAETTNGYVMESNWQATPNTNPTASFTGSGGDAMAAIAVELAFGSFGGQIF